MPVRIEQKQGRPGTPGTIIENFTGNNTTGWGANFDTVPEFQVNQQVGHDIQVVSGQGRVAQINGGTVITSINPVAIASNFPSGVPVNQFCEATIGAENGTTYDIRIGVNVTSHNGMFGFLGSSLNAFGGYWLFCDRATLRYFLTRFQWAGNTQQTVGAGTNVGVALNLPWAVGDLLRLEARFNSPLSVDLTVLRNGAITATRTDTPVNTVYLTGHPMLTVTTAAVPAVIDFSHFAAGIV